MKVSLAIPVYNESKTLRELVRRVVEVPFDKELVLVDDGSKDGSRELLQSLAEGGLASWLPAGSEPRGQNEIRVILQPENRGKGAALRRAFAESTGDVVCVQDADLEYDPRDILRL